MRGPLGNIFEIQQQVKTKRASSYDRTGGNADFIRIEAGQTAVIAAIPGAGISLAMDLSTVAYWYQTEPHKPFPELPGKDQRQNMPETGFVDVHRWRHEWRKAMGFGQTLWGNKRDK